MNDEASSSAARQYGGHREEEDEAEPIPTAAELVERRKKSRQLFNRKRSERLDLLLADFDMLVYAELSIIYYMEYVLTEHNVADLIALITRAAAHSCASSSDASSNSSTSLPRRPFSPNHR